MTTAKKNAAAAAAAAAPLSPSDILAKGRLSLKAVDSAPIFQKETKRSFPNFEKNEIKMGVLLGKGGFGEVFEVLDFELHECSKPEQAATKINHDEHYDVEAAREIMALRCIRNGKARYAVKFLQNTLEGGEHVRGRIDLAIEVKYLCVLSHANIIKMRGVFETNDPLNPNFFFVMDRLFGTLTDRIEEWKLENKATKKGPFGLNRDKEATNRLLADRLLIALDVASALQYMHDKKVVYRDVKPENIGFDIRGDAKIFDLGLAKSLHPSLLAKDGLYNLTPRTGSVPFMAPEIVRGEPYNQKVDIYAFAVLLWEMLALKNAYAEHKTKIDFFHAVCVEGQRPKIARTWPLMTQQVLKLSWMVNPKDRPTFRRVRQLLKVDLSSNEEAQSRSRHLANRSKRSVHLIEATMSRKVEPTTEKAVSEELAVPLKKKISVEDLVKELAAAKHQSDIAEVTERNLSSANEEVPKTSRPLVKQKSKRSLNATRKKDVAGKVASSSSSGETVTAVTPEKKADENLSKAAAKRKAEAEAAELLEAMNVAVDLHVDDSGQRLLTWEGVRYEIFLHNKSITVKTLMRKYNINQNSPAERVKQFQAISKELCDMHKDPVQGNILVLKPKYAKPI